MLNTNEVLAKLKRLLGIKTDLQLANMFGVKPNTISTWKSRDTMQYSKIILLCKEHKIDLNELFFVDPKVVYNKNLAKRKVRLISVEHQLEYYINPERTLVGSPVFGFPTDEEVDIGFQIASDNMYPTLKVGSYALAKEIGFEELKTWHIYLLLVEGRGILCYRFKNHVADKGLLFVSDNAAHESIVLQPQEVKKVFCIRGLFLPHIKDLPLPV